MWQQQLLFLLQLVVVVLRFAACVDLQNSSACARIRSRLEGFFRQQSRKHRRHLLYLPAGGLGDQASGFLGAVVLAMLTDRVLLVPRAGFFHNGLEPTFETTEVREVPAATAVPPSACKDRSLRFADWTRRVRKVYGEDVGVTNMYCAEHQIQQVWGTPQKLVKIFDATLEIAKVGNVGDPLFRLWLSINKIDPNHPDNLPCAFRALLRPTRRSESVFATAVPWEPGKKVVAIHVRASRFLVGNTYDVANDNVFGCEPPDHQAANFTDVWAAARLVEDDFGADATWFLVTDSAALKRSASLAFPDNKIVTTTLVPRHNEAGCRRPREEEGTRTLFTLEEEVIAELWLMTKADALVSSRSRFSTLALFLCESCTRAVYLAPCTHAQCTPVESDTLRRKYIHRRNPYDLSRPVFFTGLGMDSYGSQHRVGNHVAIDKITRSGRLVEITF